MGQETPGLKRSSITGGLGPSVQTIGDGDEQLQGVISTAAFKLS